MQRERRFELALGFDYGLGNGSTHRMADAPRRMLQRRAYDRTLHLRNRNDHDWLATDQFPRSKEPLIDAFNFLALPRIVVFLTD